MIPYIAQPTLDLGFTKLYAFGALVALAIGVGAALARRRARQEGLDGAVTDRLVGWIVVGGFLGAHLVDRLAYFPADTLAHPLSLVMIWEGLSSFGGLLGAIAGALLFFHRVKIGKIGFAHIDAVAYALPFGWILGRLGCTLAFDHPGKPTSFILGEVFTDGVVRHNLGLEELLYTVALAAVFAVLGRNHRPAGFFAGLLALLYAPVRFGLDFLRIVDVRYFGLTPAQFGAIGLAIVGAVILARVAIKEQQVAVA
jgi:phosphatidylglycerol---prolipoprotein diacylglyceryl transferase